jgi:anti-anti-sigma regulatory factor
VSDTAMEINQEVGIVVLKPQGRLGLEQATGMLSKIRAAEAGVEFDLSQVDSIEVSMLQVILVTVASMRRRGLLAVVKDSDSGVLRQTLLLTGIAPEQAGLSARITL